MRAALDADDVDVTYVEMREDTSLYDFMVERWRARETFVMVEHDIVPWPGAIQGIWDCPEPYCARPYRILDYVMGCWGCTKFDASMMERWADLIECAGRREWPKLPHGRHWNSLDSRVGYELRARGYPELFGHQHFPAVMHLHSYGPDLRSGLEACRSLCANPGCSGMAKHGGLCDDCYWKWYGRLCV